MIPKLAIEIFSNNPSLILFTISGFLCIFVRLLESSIQNLREIAFDFFPLELIWGVFLALIRNGTLLFGCIHQKIRANCQSPLIDRANCLLVSSSMYVPRTLMKEISSKSTTVQLIPWKSQLNPLTHMCQCDREKYSSSFVKGCYKHLWWLLIISLYFSKVLISKCLKTEGKLEFWCSEVGLGLLENISIANFGIKTWFYRLEIENCLRIVDL